MNFRLEELRKSYKYTKKDFALLLKITPQSYDNYSSGKRIIPTEIAIRIRSIFNISLDWLLSGDGNKKPDFIINSNLNQQLEEQKNYKLFVFITKKYSQFIENILEFSDDELIEDDNISQTILFKYIKFIKIIKNERSNIDSDSSIYGYKASYQKRLIKFISEENISLFQIDDLLKIDEPSIIFIENYIKIENNEIYNLLQIFSKRICFIHLIIFLFLENKITLERFEEMYKIKSEKEMINIFEKEKLITPFFAHN